MFYFDAVKVVISMKRILKKFLNNMLSKMKLLFVLNEIYVLRKTLNHTSTLMMVAALDLVGFFPNA